MNGLLLAAGEAADFDVLIMLYYLALILIFTKGFGMLFRKIGLPQVAGMVVGGLVLGILGYFHTDTGFFSIFMKPSIMESDVLKTFSQIGVILILFSSGLETNVKELKESGLKATLIACAGVLVPIVLGTLGSLAFLKGYSDFSRAKIMNALFIGVILAATSVGITVETLKELGKLSTKLGTTIVSAAIIDDVIGIVVLSVLTALQGAGGVTDILITLGKAAAFFALSIGLGLLIRKIFKAVELKHPHTRRTPIFAVGICFLYSFIAERFFGIAAITGAYMAGLILSGLSDTSYVDRRISTSGYILFTPVFFAYIGISADFSGLSLSYLWFALAFIALGIIGKIVGCGGVAKLAGMSKKDSLACGYGMIARGEVALAVCSLGENMIMPEGGIDPVIATVGLIVVSSILCPILLKTVFKKDADGSGTSGINTVLPSMGGGAEQ